jgi:hypothetical protein
MLMWNGEEEQREGSAISTLIYGCGIGLIIWLIALYAIVGGFS